jgi:ubiquitin carboxyl-terminal hydrolase 7
MPIVVQEIMFEPNVMCEHVDKKLTFQESEVQYVHTRLMHTKLLHHWFSFWFVFTWMQLGNGDIICFQKASEMVNENHFRYPDVPSYLEYVHDGQVFSFWCLIKGN